MQVLRTVIQYQNSHRPIHTVLYLLAVSFLWHEVHLDRKSKLAWE